MQYKNTSLYNRISAALIGFAAGNALGNPARGEDWQSFGQSQGRTPQFTPWEDSTGKHNAGEMDLIAHLALAAARRAGSEGQPLTSQLLFDELKRITTSGKNLGSLPFTLTLARGIHPGDACAVAVPELVGPEALLVGLIFGVAHAGDPQRAALETKEACSLYISGSSLQAGQIGAAAAASAFTRGSNAATVLQTAVDMAPPPVSRVLKPAAIFAREHQGHPLTRLIPAMHDRFSVSNNEDQGRAVEALAVGLACLYISDGQTAMASEAAVSYGGWAQAAGATSGAIGGALAGLSGLPQAWQTIVRSANPLVPFDSLAEGICNVAISDSQRQILQLEYLSEMANGKA